MIIAVRQVVYDRILPWSTIPVSLRLPQDVNEGPPAYVVGRPQVTEGTQRSLMSFEVPVYVLGRTSTARDDDAQAELDAAADALLAQLWKPPQEPGMSLRLSRVTPTVTAVGSVDYPSYTATLLATTAPC